MNEESRILLQQLSEALSRMNDIQDRSALPRCISVLLSVKASAEVSLARMPQQNTDPLEAAIDCMEEAAVLLEAALEESDEAKLIEGISEAVELIEEAASFPAFV